MANQRQIKRLEDITQWNQWRKDEPDFLVDLSGANLSGADLRDANLSKAVLFQTDLRGANLHEANLREAVLFQTDLHEADLSEADLYGANLCKTNLRGANLCKTILHGFELFGLDLREANLSESDLSSANLSDAKLSGAKLTGANLREANLSESDLSESDLSGADLSGADLSGVILSKADLSRVDLGGANLSDANLSEANLSEAVLARADFDSADLGRVDLSGVDLSDVDLSTASLSDVDLRALVDLSAIQDYNINFSGSNLSGIDASDPEIDLDGIDLNYADLSYGNFYRKDLRYLGLCGAKLIGADLSETNLSGNSLSKADLSRAILSQTQALGTDFTNAIFTGACLEDWNINSETKFEGAICEYFYRKANLQERRPRKGTFKPGEFAALFQQAVDTVDLIFKDGIDWQAFFQSFQDLRSQYADQDLSIQAIERKRGGAFVVRLEVPPEADKPAIESSAKELYETKLALMEQRYRAELNAKEGEIVAYKEQSANLMEIVKLQASRPITVEATAVAENKTSKYNLSNAQFAGGFAETVQGDQIGGNITNQAAEAPSLAEAAAEIQNLLKQLETSNPTATATEQTAYLNALIPPTRRQRFIGALQSAGEAALDTIPYGAVLKALVEGWKNPKG